MQNKLLFSFVLADNDASAEIADDRFSRFGERMQFRASVLAFGGLKAGDVDSLLLNQLFDFIFKLTHTIITILWRIEINKIKFWFHSLCLFQKYRYHYSSCFKW